MSRLPLRKWALVSVGVIAMGLGIVGIFVPLLPTTPLLLLAAACFVRSSDRLYHWLISRRWFGNYIRNYREHRAITLRAKIVTLVLLWGVIGYTALSIVAMWWLRGLLAIIAIGVTLHVLRLKTLTKEMVSNSQDPRAADQIGAMIHPAGKSLSMCPTRFREAKEDK